MPAEKDPATGKFVSADAAAKPVAETTAAPAAPADAKKAVEAEKPKEPKEFTSESPTSRFFEEFTRPKKEDAATKEKPKADKEKADKEKEKQAPAAAAAAAKPATKPAAAKPAAKPTPEPVDVEKIIRSTAEAVTKAIRPADQPKKDEKTADPDADLSAPDKRRIEVLSHLEKTQPEKYTGVAQKFREFRAKLNAYSKSWEKSHPGQAFDATDAEHEDFYTQNNLYQPWEDEDFDEARINLIASKEAKAASKPLEDELATLRNEKKILESKDTIVAHQLNSAINFWDKIGDDYKGLVLPNGQYDAEKLKSVKSLSPHILETLLKENDHLDKLVENTYLIKQHTIPYDPQNPIHAELGDFVVKKQNEWAAKPQKAKLNQHGQSFLPNDEYMKLPPEQKKGFWTFNETDISLMLAEEKALKMKDFITREEEKFSKWAESRGIKLPTKEEKAGMEAAGKQAPASTEDEEIEASPSAGGSPKVAEVAKAAAKPAESGVKTFFKGF